MYVSSLVLFKLFLLLLIHFVHLCIWESIHAMDVCDGQETICRSFSFHTWDLGVELRSSCLVADALTNQAVTLLKVDIQYPLWYLPSTSGVRRFVPIQSRNLSQKHHEVNHLFLFIFGLLVIL